MVTVRSVSRWPGGDKAMALHTHTRLKHAPARSPYQPQPAIKPALISAPVRACRRRCRVPLDCHGLQSSRNNISPAPRARKCCRKKTACLRTRSYVWRAVFRATARLLAHVSGSITRCYGAIKFRTLAVYGDVVQRLSFTALISVRWIIMIWSNIGLL